MKTLDLFIVELEKKINDTVVTDSGLELYVDGRFNEFEHRVTEGPVICSPLKYNTGVKEGDTLYFHHLVVINEGQALTGCPDQYLIRYNENETISNQAIAFKCQNTGEVRPLAGWSLLEPVEEEEEVESIIFMEKKEDLPTKARVSFNAPWLKELGVNKGDVVGFKKNRDYRIKIEDKEYFRTRVEDLMYVIEE
jgi:co-chaperonin GroES (HSP10)|tara:strand:+ start:1433 stop:2014 length:582 start_codon:yes stop_codon:yes gene_type:complete